jgi:hypothetical protein
MRSEWCTVTVASLVDDVDRSIELCRPAGLPIPSMTYVVARQKILYNFQLVSGCLGVH